MTQQLTTSQIQRLMRRLAMKVILRIGYNSQETIANSQITIAAKIPIHALRLYMNW
jgi:hypothetical protein